MALPINIQCAIDCARSAANSVNASCDYLESLLVYASALDEANEADLVVISDAVNRIIDRLDEVAESG